MYKDIKRLGKGAYGEVWKVKKYDKIIALKKVKLENDEQRKMALKEVTFLKELVPCVPSLICFHDYLIKDGYLFIEMDYIEGQTLNDFSKNLRGIPLLNTYLLSIIQDIAPGLDYLHSKNIIHRDIKPDNIMIDEKHQPKLIDIGLACFSENKCYLEDKVQCCVGYAGSPLFSPPELLLQNISYFVSDIFSFGASIYYAATGNDIYYPRPKNVKQLKEMATYVDFPRLKTPKPQLNYLVNAMTLRQPEDRMTTQEIIEYFK